MNLLAQTSSPMLAPSGESLSFFLDMEIKVGDKVRVSKDAPMMCVRSTSQFIEKAHSVHKGKYDYSMVEYQNTDTPVAIICPIHGIFSQKPKRHLLGCGCPKCKADKAKRMVCGVGINDMYGVSELQSYKTWDAMIRRCYTSHSNKPTYVGCSVSSEWLLFSNFKKWFDDNYIEGYQLDKDILVNGNKIYSAATCCFVPQRINVLFRSMRSDKCVFQHSTYRYYAEFTVNHERVNLGHFDSREEANKVAREYERKMMLQTIEEYIAKGEITHEVYNAIKNRYE